MVSRRTIAPKEVWVTLAWVPLTNTSKVYLVLSPKSTNRWIYPGVVSAWFDPELFEIEPSDAEPEALNLTRENLALLPSGVTSIRGT